MQATKQQQIMSYFIEEAREHLDTIEQRLLHLKATMADSDQLNELFRAAHSIKGGAAMLGLGTIQQVSHYLEDYFKLLKDHPVEIDRNLEDLFLKVFDTLKELIDELQSPYGLQEDHARRRVAAAKPYFTKLGSILKRQIQTRAHQPAPPTQTSAELAASLNVGLKKMLELFKQGDSATTRQQLLLLCRRIAQLHHSREWQELLQAVQGAIAQPQLSYHTLAPVVIRELKQSSDLLTTGRSSEIISSYTLRQLVLPPPKPEQPPLKRQITIPTEPRAAAKALLDTFNREQLIELAEFLMQAIR